MESSLQNKVILITGGGSGIGRATAICCAQRGARIIVSDIDEAGGAETVRAVEATGAKGRFARCDVTQADQVDALVQGIVSAEGRLDGAFNNAGIESDWGALVRNSEETFDRTLAVNVKGVWLCLRAEIRQLLEQRGGGSIVNTASVAGLVGVQGGAPYVASKHAVVGLSKTAALDYAEQGIRVNAVCPGVIDTPMVDRLVKTSGMTQEQLLAMEPIGRVGQPAEIGEMVAWLLSDAASFVTGAAIPADGGFVAG